MQVKILSTERYDTSRNGNPRYLCVAIDKAGKAYSFFTGVDSSHGYSITNYVGKDIEISLKPVRGKSTLDNLSEV